MQKMFFRIRDFVTTFQSLNFKSREYSNHDIDNFRVRWRLHIVQSCYLYCKLEAVEDNVDDRS
jgi:hypothetical protein